MIYFCQINSDIYLPRYPLQYPIHQQTRTPSYKYIFEVTNYPPLTIKFFKLNNSCKNKIHKPLPPRPNLRHSANSSNTQNALNVKVTFLKGTLFG